MRTSPLVVALLLGLLAQPAVAAEPAAEAVDVAAEPAAEATDAAKASTPATPDPVLGAPRPPEIPLEDIRTFTAVFRAVQDAYVEPVDDHTLMQSAIRGLLAGLDPHSEFLDTRGLGELDEQATGEYAGLGVEVLFMEGVLRVIAPIDDTPAQRAGIKPGDIILRIDGELIGADEGDRAVERLRGKAGSQTTLSVLREGLDVPLEITLRRERIKVASVRARSLEPGYAYVRISQFQQETGAELRRKLRQISGNGRIKGTVLDLRSNPGGLLNAAVEVSDAFLDSGVIVSTRGRLADSDLSFSATEGDLTSGAPLVVLVDGGTASAAEIVAGALKDNHRALVMGTRTFGKGSVQTVLPLEPLGAVKLTTARYYTPGGVSIQASGIVPDIALADLQLSAPDRPATPLTSERSLPGHLQGDGEGASDGSPERDSALDDDYALNEALNVLKGLHLARERSGTKPKG